MKLSARLLVITGTVLMTFGAATAAHAAGTRMSTSEDRSSYGEAGHEARWGYGDGYSDQNSDEGAHRDENNSRPPNCGDDHRWGPGDGYSSQNPGDEGLCRSKGQGGGHEGDTKGGGTAGGGGGMGHY